MAKIILIKTLLKPGFLNPFSGFCLLLFALPSYTDDSLSQSVLSSSVEEVTEKNDLIEESKKILEKDFEGKTREELYREIFGIDAPAMPKEIEAVIKVNNKSGNRIDVVFSEDRENFTVPAKPVVGILSDVIDKNLLKEVIGKIDKFGRISKNDLDLIGLLTEFDSEERLVTVFVPPKLRTKQIHQLKYSKQDPYLSQSIKPANFSGYLNINATQQLRYLQDLSDDSSSIYSFYGSNDNICQPLYCNFHGALNIMGAVAEGGALYRESNNTPFQRKDVRIVYDFPQRTLRLAAGDIRYGTVGYQSHVPIGGISLSKDYSLAPHILSYPLGDYEFYLVDPAEVEVWVNGVMVRKIVLEPGTHNIQNYPFAEGSNEVEIVIRDFSGRRETIDFSFLHEPELLAKNFSQYSFNAGFAETRTSDRYQYDSRNPFVSLMYRRGITNRFTMDVYGQAFRDKGIVGTECLYAIPAGNLFLSSAVTYLDTAGFDMAARMGFHYRSKIRYSQDDENNKRRLSTVNWKTEAEYLGRKFPGTLEQKLRFYEESFRLITDLSIPLDQIRIGARGEYDIRPDTTDYFSIGLNLQKRWAGKINTQVGFKYSTDNKLHEANPMVTLSVQWSFMKNSNFLNVRQGINKRNPLYDNTYDLTDNNSDRRWDFTTDVNWDYVSLKPKPEKPIMGVSTRLNREYSDYNAKLGYSGNAGSMEVNHTIAEPGFASNTFLQHHTNINLKTALVFTPTALALSRPVHGGFLIAKGNKNLKKHTVRINDRDNGYDATSTWFGGAVLPLFSQYQLMDVKISPVDAPLASVDEKQDFTLFPQYKSGFLITIGSDKKVFVTGSLINKKEEVFEYQQIKFIENAKENGDTVVTFTNQAGRFQFLAKVGKTYSVEVADEYYEKGSINIPADLEDYYNAGDIILNEIDELDSKEVESDPFYIDSVFTDENGPLNEENKEIGEEKETDEKETGALDSLTETQIEEAAKKLNDPLGRYVYISGNLCDSSGILKNEAISVNNAENGTSGTTSTFTDNKGSFQFILREPGSYNIRTKIAIENGDSVYGFVGFNVPEEKMGSFFQLGKLVLDADNYKIPDEEKHDSSSGSTIMVSGRITDSQKKPLRFTRIMFSSLDTTFHTFTDVNGKFNVICNSTGMYIICESGLNNKKNRIIRIPENTKGFFDLGVLELSEK